MKAAIVRLVSAAPYSQSRHYDTIEEPKLPKELHDAYEQRTWRRRMHVLPDGHVEIPASAFANALMTAAKRLAIPVPGKRGALFTKHFEAGVMVTEGIRLPIKAADVPGERLFLNADGRRGGGTRVIRYYPRIDSWEGKLTFFLFDDLITEDVFRQALAAAGLLVGIGRFRPENRGHYGRFSIADFRWVEGEEALALAAGSGKSRAA